jgi:hypothetical protein
VSAFICEQKERGFAVELICRTLGVSRSAHYQRQSGPPSTRAVRDAELIETIREDRGAIAAIPSVWTYLE